MSKNHKCSGNLPVLSTCRCTW